MSQQMLPNYVGRFAPSPSGPLHQGSLVAALGSWLDARHHQGTWLIRIEDLDTPRNQPGAESHILRSLEAHGLNWDDTVVRQSERLPLYEAAIHQLSHEALVFPCACSRREIEDQGGIYPGTCRSGLPFGKVGRALRVRCAETTLQFIDRGLGPQSEKLAEQTGDFILKRADGVYSYQLAVVVDDIQQGVTQIVRGADLLRSTARQLFLYSAFDQTPPQYLHLPLVMSSNGQKLSKQNRAPALDDQSPIQNLYSALCTLHGALKVSMKEAPKESIADLLRWAIQNWAIPLQGASPIIWDASQMEFSHDHRVPHSAPSFLNSA